MGNSESNRSTAQNGNNSNRPVPVLGSVNGYNYQQNPYAAQPYVYPAYYGYPGYYDPYGYMYYGNVPVVSNADTVAKKMYPKTKSTSSVPVNGASTAQQHNNTAHRHSHHHPHATHSHHHSHHHNHPHQLDQIPLPTEKERLSPPIASERVVSRRPSLQQPSTVTITKIASPSVHKQTVSPPLPRPSVQAQNLMSTRISPQNPMPTSVTPQNASPRAPSVLTQKPLPSAIFQQNKSAVQSSKASDFVPAPPIETNYVSRSPDNKTMQSYGPDTLSIVRRSGLNPSAPGNRWYDHDYDKRVKPLDINYQ